MPAETKKTENSFPVLALRGLVAFPSMILTLDVGRKRSVNAINRAMSSNQLIYLVTQKDITVEAPNSSDLYSMGCLCRLRQTLKMPDGSVKALVQGLYRAKHTTFIKEPDIYSAVIEKCEEKPIKNRAVYKESILRRIRIEFEKYVEVNRNIAPDVISTVATCDDIPYLCDYIAFNVPSPFDDKQFILEQLSPVSRAKILLELLSKEKEICEIDNKIGEKTKRRIDESQKEYYLKEQIKVLNDELYGDDELSEIESYNEKAEKLDCSDEVKNKIRSEINKLSKLPPGSHEGTVMRSWLDLAISLPWNKKSGSKVDIKKAEKILDRDFYGLDKVKERILEMLAVYSLNPDITGQIICLAGPPGVGKTSIGKTIAECMGRKYRRVALGGMHDEAEIRGHRKTYVGAMPGRIISALKLSGVSDPLILLDEIDKLASDYKGDPSSALLEVLDPEQNSSFTDNFLEIPYDLSKAVFITTANDVSTVPPALLDRMEVIYIDGYTREERFNIAKKHLVKKELSRHALSGRTCRITDGALYAIIDFYTREAGVRSLERTIAKVFSKVAKIIAEGEVKSVTVKEQDIYKYLGTKKYRPESILETDEIGIINGLAWTAVGGEIMQLEVAATEGTGKIIITGSLGDIMKESASAAVTFVRLNALKYGIYPDFYKNLDIHIHATEAAVKKDGPSAGVTIATALVSALTKVPVKRDIAMTGEITITGRVLAIGGLKEKSMAAYRGGVKRVFIPYDNIPDLDEIDKTVKENVEFIPVKNASEIIEAALKFPEEEKSKELFISQNSGEKAVSRC